MAEGYRRRAFSPAVRRVQAREGSGAAEGLDAAPGPADRLGLAEAAFLQAADSFYLATVSDTGWPYVQHRGGPPGFLRVLGPDRIGWAEFAGNRHYITTGNLDGNDRVALFVPDHLRRARLKLMGHARLVPADAPEAAALVAAAGGARVERAVLVEVAGFDWNCPQHIVQRFTLADVEAATGRMMARIAELEAQLAARG